MKTIGKIILSIILFPIYFLLGMCGMAGNPFDEIAERFWTDEQGDDKKTGKNIIRFHGIKINRDIVGAMAVLVIAILIKEMIIK